MLDRLDDTIVAISTASGRAALGIVRLSGPAAIDIAAGLAKLAAGKPITELPGSSRVGGEVFIDADLSLPADFYVFRAPRSYTRQNMVEIHTIGSPPVLELVRLRAAESGARQAEPGEFTARAFVNGAMDLRSAEAVAGVIRARTDTQLRASRRMMDGALADRISELRDDLAELLALIEADIDFSEEPIEFIRPSALVGKLGAVGTKVRQLLDGSVSVERFDALPHILLFGAPNVGKSSLMNRLSGTDRSICAAAAGTTRDILSAPMMLGRGEAILLDAAGVDRSDDEIIARARAMVVSTAERVDLVCLVVDAAEFDENTEHVLDTVASLDIPRIVVVGNKSDRIAAGDIDGVRERLAVRDVGPVCLVSALNGNGIDDLRRLLANALESSATTTLGESILISMRQAAALRAAAEAVGHAIALARTVAETIDCADLLAFELREALDALGAVTGAITTEDLLGQVFARFCIGK